MNTENLSATAPIFERSRPPEPPTISPQPLHPALHPVRARSNEWQRGRKVDKGAVPVAETVPFGDALPLQDFRKDLEREKRRSDRCKSPLSLVLFQVGDDARNTVAFLDVVHRITREIDVVGHVGNDLIALLCPNTDESGVRAALRKVEASAQGLGANAVAVVTHPDLLFDRISAGELSRGLTKPTEGNAEATRLTPAFVSDRRERKAHGYALKRTIDIAGAVAGVVVLSPLMLLTAIAVGLTSRGPIIFRQTRVGQGGKPFNFYKFRSMTVGSDDRIHRAYVADLIDGKVHPNEISADGGQRLYKLRSDPRITPVGQFIRKTSIDELPQLFNVLKGDMSLVGPRPPIPYEASRYQAWHLRRLFDAKPGLTGLWQVEGRSKVSFDEMVRMDLRYIRDCSLELDLRILAKTVKVVLRCEGAT